MTRFVFHILCIAITTATLSAQNTFRKDFMAMGSGFQITVVAKDSLEGYSSIEKAIEEIQRIERLISSWDVTSETSKINRNAGIKSVEVSEELFSLIERAKKLSILTDGAFDISYASMDHIWKFDGSIQEMPTESVIKQSVSKVGYKKILLDKNHKSVFLSERGMKIGFGAIGKGYAADRAKSLLLKMGISGGIVNASGDMTTWGKQASGEEWTVAITNPLNKNKAFASLPITDGAVVTSGNYEKYITIDGKRYTHIIDPRNGYPSSGLLSVTVFAPMAELADALATSVFVMGKEPGLNRINQLPKIECVIIDEQGQMFTSNNIKIDKL